MSRANLTELNDAELDAVTGGTYNPCECYCPPPKPPEQNAQGNNGFGQEKRGGDDGAPPGRGGGRGFIGTELGGPR